MDTEFDLSFGNSDAPEGSDSGAVSKKEAKLQQKLAARERSKAKRKQQKIESKKLVTSASEEAVANHIKDPNPILVSNFDAEKEETVALVNELTSDKSRAGRIDEAIIPFSKTINAKTHFYTTSSCAGRTIIVNSFQDADKNKKYNIGWVYLTHDMADSNEAWTAIENELHKPQTPRAKSGAEETEVPVADEIWFKMEPVIVAIRARNIVAANVLLNMARTNGLKNSGIRSISVDGTVNVTLVDTYKIEALVALEGKLVITKPYLELLVESGNRKLLASRERIERLRQIFEAQL